MRCIVYSVMQGEIKLKLVYNCTPTCLRKYSLWACVGLSESLSCQQPVHVVINVHLVEREGACCTLLSWHILPMHLCTHLLIICFMCMLSVLVMKKQASNKDSYSNPDPGRRQLESQKPSLPFSTGSTIPDLQWIEPYNIALLLILKEPISAVERQARSTVSP